MLPIVRFPRIVAEQAPWFDPVFATDEQRKHFREYVTGLIAGDEATVTAINNLFLERNDQSALNKFLTQAEWDELDLNRRWVEWELKRLRRRGGWSSMRPWRTTPAAGWIGWPTCGTMRRGGTPGHMMW